MPGGCARSSWRSSGPATRPSGSPRFDAVEPENRLVARSLESDWEARLFTLRQAEADLAAQRSRRPAVLTEEEVAWLSRAGADLRAVFDAEATTIRERKQLLRLLVSEVVITVDRDAAQAAVRIRWKVARVPISLSRCPAAASIARSVPRPTRWNDSAAGRPLRRATIARLLVRQGVMTATGLRSPATGLAACAANTGSPGPPNLSDPTARCAHGQRRRSRDTAGHLPRHLYRWLSSGFIRGEQHGPGGPWRIRIDAELRAKITPDAPEGSVGLERPPADSAWPNRPSWTGSPRRAQRRPRQPWPTQRPGHPTATAEDTLFAPTP